MSDDLIARLHIIAYECYEQHGPDRWVTAVEEAADRIERLEGFLAKMIWDCDHDGPEDFCGKDRCACEAIMPVLGEYDVGEYDA